MSIANIWKFQENIAALCRKISQNVGRTYREASGEHRGTVQNGCKTLQVSAIRGSGYVWPRKLKRSPLSSDVRIPDVMVAEQNITSGCKVVAAGCKLVAAGWNGGALPLSGCGPSGWNVSGWNDNILSGYVFRMPFDDVSGGLVRIYSLHSGIAYGFQRTLLNLGLLWW